jgi:uncharacterized membrane protein
MADIEGLLNRWKSAGVLEGDAAERIRAWESGQKRPSGLHWQGAVALILGGFLLATGVILFVSAHWDDISPGTRFALLIALVAIFHLAALAVRSHSGGLSTTLHAVGTVIAGLAVMFVGQAFGMNLPWHRTLQLWMLCALAGWVLLRDEAHETFTLLLIPAWIVSEFQFHAEGHSGVQFYMGRILLVWSILLLTALLGSARKAMQGIVFAACALAVPVAVEMMVNGWNAVTPDLPPLPFGTRLWGWIAIGVLPVLLSLFSIRRSTLPVSAAVAVGILLPASLHRWIAHMDPGNTAASFTRGDATPGTYLLVAAFALFAVWWGLRMASQVLVNLGIVWFALVVTWFYFSSVFGKLGRSFGLVGLGVLFLAGGWALEIARRRLLDSMKRTGPPALEAR